ncbi:DUF2878 domain-containing protein [Methylobacillus sp. Pita2]|uniref:DUF2878 domain-containing protein n=1 Tax=Methylobacillus sp. Pita2 TaxID=3383245 RepID=UPI0038B4E51B
MPRSLVVQNFVLFQVGWFICVYGAANHLPWIALLVMMVVLSWHFHQATQWQVELKLIVLFSLTGALLDQLLLALQLVSFPASVWPGAWLPPWMLCLWILFATTLNVSLRWLKPYYWLGVILGAVGAALAYKAGEKLGAIHLHGEWALMAIAINWSLAMPFGLYLARRYDGFSLKATDQEP